MGLIFLATRSNDFRGCVVPLSDAATITNRQRSSQCRPARTRVLTVERTVTLGALARRVSDGVSCP
jgi:hypothetical protein